MVRFTKQWKHGWFDLNVVNTDDTSPSHPHTSLSVVGV